VNDDRGNKKEFPISAGILFGLGLGGSFDGIMLHQVLQWHHTLTSAGYPANSVHNLEVNTLWDGLFHVSTYVFVVLGLIALWRTAHRAQLGRLLPARVDNCARHQPRRPWIQTSS
jgi:uncharacterized membrane protein